MAAAVATNTATDRPIAMRVRHRRCPTRLTNSTDMNWWRSALQLRAQRINKRDEAFLKKNGLGYPRPAGLQGEGVFPRPLKIEIIYFRFRHLAKTSQPRLLRSQHTDARPAMTPI